MLLRMRSGRYYYKLLFTVECQRDWKDLGLHKESSMQLRRKAVESRSELKGHPLEIDREPS